jgi:amino acid transporter
MLSTSLLPTLFMGCMSPNLNAIDTRKPAALELCLEESVNMKKDIPAFLLFIAIAVGLFVVYALFVTGMDVNSAIGLHRSDLSSMTADAIRFLTENKIAAVIVLAVLALAKFLAGSPGPVKS